MEDVSQSLTKLNSKSQLLVVRGDPATLIPSLCQKWGITHLCFEQDVSGYARSRDESIRKLVKEQCKDVQIVEEQGHYLYAPEDILNKYGKKPTMSMSAVQKAVSSLPPPPKPRDAPKSIPDPILPGKKAERDRISVLKALAETLSDLPHYNSQEQPIDLNAAAAGGDRLPDAEKGRVACYDTVYGPDSATAAKQAAAKDKEVETLFGVPSLASLGMDAVASGALPEAVIKGGETEALKRWNKVVEDKHYLATFAKPKTAPTQPTDDPATTVMSPYLKFGAISVRKIWYDTQEVIKSYKGKDKTSIPENYEGQLLFREMYAVGELALGDEYQQIRNNKISRYMDWYLPNVYDDDGKRIEPRPRGDEASEKRLELFVQGRTGFPWIDALVRQLRATGWVHHLGRHSLAAFLTRGQCWISSADPSFSRPGFSTGILARILEIGVSQASVSQSAESLRIDGENPQSYFRVYGVASFPAKYDKHGALVRRYCPELKDFPDKYIYAPHTAPIDVQKKAKCIIGQDYPHPMLDEKEEKSKCLARCKAAYEAGFYGTSKEVLEGKAEAILRKKHGQPNPEEPDTSKAVSKASKIPEWAKPSVGVSGDQKKMSAKPWPTTASKNTGMASKGKKEESEDEAAAAAAAAAEDQEEDGADDDQDPDTADHDDDHVVRPKAKSTPKKRGSKGGAAKDGEGEGAEGDGDEASESPRRSKRARTSASKPSPKKLK
ncbi:hypothetical protein OC861_002866 [Tilletia horrida]|nr:hypothetical protein OC861_002866 [Tilletia horrida]